MTAVSKIHTQLLAAQKQFKGASKDSTNPHYRSKYADLTSVWDACKEALHKNGLYVSHSTEGNENGWHLKTRVYNADGEYLESIMPILFVGSDPQKFGSALTYARRYSLSALLGLMTEDDDDANGALDRDKTGKPKETKKEEDDGKPWMNESQFEAAKIAIAAKKATFEQAQAKYKMKNEYRETLKAL